MNYKIYFGLERDDCELEPQFIGAWEFMADFESLYTSAALTLNDFTRTYYNQIQKGMDIIFKFYDGDHVTNSQKIYTNTMKVLSFDKIPAPQSLFNDTTNFLLVNSLYFDDNKPDTKSYNGTVYSIANSVLLDYPTVKKDFSLTDDAASPRYQSGDTAFKFLKRISRFGIQNDLPVYLYMDATNTLKLKGIKEMIDSSSFYTAAPLLDNEIPQYTADSSSTSSNKIALSNYRFSSEGKDISSSTSTYFEVENFTSNDAFYPGSVFNNTEINNVQTAELTPPSINFLNWNLNPHDAYSIAKRQAFEKSINSYFLVATTPGLRADALHPGSLVKVLLPYDTINIGGQEKNLGEGEYLVKRVKYVFDGDAVFTQLYLIQANY